MAFAYTPKEHRIQQIDTSYGPVEEQITEITRQDQKPPEPPKKIEVKVIADILEVVTNDTKINTDMEALARKLNARSIIRQTETTAV